jgi:ABC-2 type transport system ATP-binding protein
MLELVKSVSHGKGLNVIVSSHLLPDIERVCDRVVVVMRGQLRAQGTIKDLKKIEGQPIDIELRDLSAAFVNAMVEKGANVLPPKRTTYRIQMAGSVEDVARTAMQAAREAGAQIRGFAQAERSLEDAFLDAINVSAPPPPPPVTTPGGAV